MRGGGADGLGGETKSGNAGRAKGPDDLATMLALAQLPQFAEVRSSVFRHLASESRPSRHYISAWEGEIWRRVGRRRPSRSRNRAWAWSGRTTQRRRSSWGVGAAG